jgi:hypothetical protein
MRLLREFAQTHASTSCQADDRIHEALARLTAAAQVGYRVAATASASSVPETVEREPVPAGFNHGTWPWLASTVEAVRAARAAYAVASARYGRYSAEEVAALGRYREAQDSYRCCVLHREGEELVRALLARVQGQSSPNVGDLTPIVELFQNELAEEGARGDYENWSTAETAAHLLRAMHAKRVTVS